MSNKKEEKSDKKEDSANNILNIEHEAQLPKGQLISYDKDDLEVPEKNRKELMAWSVENTTGQKIVWILSVRNAYNNIAYMQLVKNAENLGYKVAKKGLISPEALNVIYDKRNFTENQKASSDDSLVVGMFELILADALKENVSDIHIEVRTNGAVIRMRKNGEMMIYNPNQSL